MRERMSISRNAFSTLTGYANFHSHNSSATTVVSSENFDEYYMPIEIGKYSIFDVANWFLSKAPMTQKKLQKLCYYAQAWSYALKNIRFIDADFQAWTHGPVSPVLYEKFKYFGFDTIKMSGEYVATICCEDITFLENVWETYGDYTGNALEALTHSEMPWKRAREGYAPNERCSIVISPDSMKEYYNSIYRK